MIALTGDDDRAGVLRYMTHVDANFGFAVAIGGAPGYAVTSLPSAALVDPEGKLVWFGPAGNFPKKRLEELLRTVPKPTAERNEARAAKLLAHAESLAADKLLLRAESAFQQVQKLYPGTGAAKDAAERAKAMSAAENEAEYDAQREVAKVVGGVERPAEKLDDKKAASAAKRLRKRAEELRPTAPRAAKLAAEWAEILATPWK